MRGGGGGGFRSGGGAGIRAGGGGFHSGITGGGIHRGFGTPGIRSGGYSGYHRPAIRGYYGGYGYRYSYPLYLGGFGWGGFGWGSGWPWYGSSSYFPAYSEYTAPAGGTYYGDPYGAANTGPVIINNSYEPERSRPADVRVYPDWNQPAERASNEPPLYLIARTDDTVIAAVAYWVEGDTLHYVDRRHEQKQIRLDQVDRALSEQLNRERRVDFRLPR